MTRREIQLVAKKPFLVLALIQQFRLRPLLQLSGSLCQTQSKTRSSHRWVSDEIHDHSSNGAGEWILVRAVAVVHIAVKIQIGRHCAEVCSGAALVEPAIDLLQADAQAAKSGVAIGPQAGKWGGLPSDHQVSNLLNKWACKDYGAAGAIFRTKKPCSFYKLIKQSHFFSSLIHC
jgi:hypothetical protein